MTLLGARQCGKSTLARAFAKRYSNAGVDPTYSFFDLERAADKRRLAVPERTLSAQKGLVVIDEVQRMPALFETLRVIMDERPDLQFLLLGSASFEIVRGISESLAGRVGVVRLAPFMATETGIETWPTLWQRGGFPRSFLAEDDIASATWRQSFIDTFLNKDIPQLGIRIPGETLRRFWHMVAHFHGQVWNASEFARSLGTNHQTARNYLDILAGSFMVRVLPPWFENIKKRQLKSPKVYVNDSGLLHAMLEIDNAAELEGHIKVGASWEGFVIEHIISFFDSRSAFYWRTAAGAELDLLIIHGAKRYGFEIKYAEAPSSTKSMHIALKDLKLDQLFVISPGDDAYELHDRIQVIPFSEMHETLTSVRDV